MNGADTAFLGRLAERAMVERGFLTQPPAQAVAEAQAHEAPAADEALDLTGLPWTSIDNPESRDLDQIEAVEKTAQGVRLLVGIADVDSYVPTSSAVERFAAHNATSIYTGVRTFPMLPEQLSFNLTSLLPNERRLAVVIETLIARGGEVSAAKIYRAVVQNRAKLDYPSVSAWLEGKAPPPGRLAEAPELKAQVEQHDELARRLAEIRRLSGALDVDTGEPRFVVDDGVVTGLIEHHQDRAGAIIEELMIASNRTVARTLDARGLASIRRIVKQPERWERIVAYAGERGATLPAAPDALELARFVETMRKTRAAQFAEISLSLIKLIGRGEYAAHRPGDKEIGHFGLATDAYTHSTAPNRRYVDLIAQRIMKGSHRYGMDELTAIAARCTMQEAAAQKVERQVHKSAAAVLVQSRLGETFDGVITGASEKGTFVRILVLPIEGKVLQDVKSVRVGDKVAVKLVGVNIEKGFIDFQLA